MSNKVKVSLVPKLRFPEFSVGQGWDAKRLGDLFRYRQESGFADLPLLSLMDKEGIVPQESSNRKNNSNSDKSKYLRVVPGDIAYNTMRMWEGRSAYVGLEGLVSPAYTVCEPKSGVNSVFFSYYFKTPQLVEQFRRYSQGLVKDTLNLKYEAFAKILVSLPNEFEQQKIADCLSSLDELIAAQARKVDALKTHKKGLMQQLFPRKGETQPRLRFPEFRDAGDWEETTLGAYFDPIRNGFVGTATPYYTTSEGVLYLQGRNIKHGKIEVNNLIFVTNDFHNRQRKSHLKTGDILMVQSGHVGECAVVGPDFDGANCHALIILTPRRKLISEFFGQYFYAPIGELAIFKITTGNTIKHILSSELKTLPVLVPSFAEQRLVADCLTSLDTLITAATQELETLKTHKKGLMQQLFPSAEAVEA
jgi:type I restriction enzyme S subunit